MRRPVLFAALIGLLCLQITAVRPSAASDSRATRQAELIRRIKLLQQQQLLGEALERHDETASWLDDASGLAPESGRDDGRTVTPGLGASQRPAPWASWGDAAGGAPRVARHPASPMQAPSFAANRAVNDPNLDTPGRYDAQTEPSIAVWGSYVLAGWNDGRGAFIPGAPPQTQPNLMHYAYSTDAGHTFVTGATPLPVLPLGGLWTSDPVFTVNEKTGDFFFCGLFDPPTAGGTDQGVAVMRANFTGAAPPVWATPVVVRSIAGSNATFIDKPWVVADSASGNVYVTYTVFTAFSDSIVFTRSTDRGVHWGPQATLSSIAGAGLVQGSRPAVGPDGELYVTWKEIGLGVTGADYMRIRRSNDLGVTFGFERTVCSFYDDFGSGAPGFNREQSIALPSIAVDRSSSATRGRVYLAWNESIDFYDSIPDSATATVVYEVEPNDSTAVAQSFTPGQAIHGSFDSLDDLDYYSFGATQGVTYVFWADQISTRYTMRIFATDGVTRLAFSGDRFNSPPNEGFIAWTCPSSGTYYLRMAIFGTTPSDYRVDTGIDTPGGPGERARDHRDTFVACSSDGATWSTPAMLSAAEPGLFDDWLPEVAVTGQGSVFAIWYDFSEAPPATCGGQSNVSIARSDDGGGSWTPLGQVTDVQTAWSFVNTNIIPNQGDYVSLFASGAAVFPCWTDGRLGTPDIFAAPFVADVVTATQVALLSAEVVDGQVRLAWDVASARGAAEVQRCEAGGAWAALATERIDGGLLTFADATARPGTRYRYRLALAGGAAPIFAGEVEVTVPGAAEFALEGALPNPARRGLAIAFTLADRSPAALELLDLAGRSVVRQAVGGLGPGRHVVSLMAGRTLAPGLYFVQLSQGGRQLASRVAVAP